MNLAIISPDKNLYSETFIQAHKRIRADRIYYYYGGYMPTHVENQGIMNISKNAIDFKTISKLILKVNPFSIINGSLSIRELLLLNSFRRNKIDVVLAEFGPSASECVRVCKKLNIPLITHFHGFDVSSAEERFTRYYPQVFDYSSYIIGVSQEMIETLGKMGAPKDKLIYTPCGPNEIFFENKPQFNNKNLVAVGRLVDKKAPYYLILSFKEILKEHPDAKLTFIGDGPLLNTCLNLVKVLNLSGSIEFAGVKSPSEIRKILENSYAFIQHSVETISGDKEGTPVGILEASAAALPVIATSHAGIKDVIINDQTGLLSPEHDIKTMALNVVLLLNDPSRARLMGEKGRENILEYFSLEKHLAILTEAVWKAFNSRS